MTSNELVFSKCCGARSVANFFGDFFFQHMRLKVHYFHISRIKTETEQYSLDSQSNGLLSPDFSFNRKHDKEKMRPRQMRTRQTCRVRSLCYPINAFKAHSKQKDIKQSDTLLSRCFCSSFETMGGLF